MFTVGAAVLGYRPGRKALIFQIMIWRVQGLFDCRKAQLWVPAVNI